MSDWAVHVDGLGKRYNLGEREQYRALRDLIAGAPRKMLGKVRSTGSDGPAESPHAWVLRNLSFQVDPGEVVGIIGHNGAGKSTLLKILSRITRPTEGNAAMRGRVGSLLEVGSGFHPELTGAENILLNGAILGMRKAEIDSRFDAIVEFAGVERFLSTPVKRYSTGMYMRLAFAVAAHLEPEILVVDEVLAVGDAEFQRKCLGRMRELASGHGRTVLFVSHDLDAVQQLCPRSLWLDRGRLGADGPSPDVVAGYLATHAANTRADRWIDLTASNRSGNGDARFSSVRYRSGDPANGQVPCVNGPVVFDLVITAREAVSVGSLNVFISTLGGTRLVNADPAVDQDLALALSPGEHRFRLTIPELHLSAGSYQVGLRLARGRDTRSWSVLDHLEGALDLTVEDPRGEIASGQGLVPCRVEFIRAPP